MKSSTNRAIGRPSPICRTGGEFVLCPRSLCRCRRAPSPPRAASFIITRRGSGGSARSEVAVDAGQALRPDGQAALLIAETQFMLFSGASRSGAEAQWAWPKNIGDELKIIALMKAGADMEIRAELENGDKIRDLYSLSGVTRGIGILIENCP